MAFLGALAPFAASAISSLVASQAPELAKMGSKLLAHGMKQSVPELLDKVKTLASSKEGRERILTKVGKYGGYGLRAGNEVLNLLNKNKILGEAATARHMETLGRIGGGLQSALGKLSKINKRFG